MASASLVLAPLCASRHRTPLNDKAKSETKPAPENEKAPADFKPDDLTVEGLLAEAAKMSDKPYIGGQAVLEGVMMRAPHSFAIVVRRRDGSLFVRERATVEERTGQ